MRRFFSVSMAASVCVAVAAMLVPTQAAQSQVRFYAGPGGVGVGFGDYGRGWRGADYGYYGNGYYGNRYYGNRYNDGWNRYDNRWDGYGRNYRYGYSYPGRYYRSYTPRTYSYQVQPRYYQGNQSYYISREESKDPDRPVMGVRIRGAGDAVRVVKVQPGSPAANAGLQEGDMITMFNGKAVTTEQALLSELDTLEPNAEVELTVRSGDSTWDTSMQLTTYREAFTGNVAHEGERRTVGRPLLDDTRSPDELQRERDMLREENQELRGPADEQPDLDADIDIPAPPLEGEANLDTDVRIDADANAPDADVNALPDVEADANIDADADINADAEIDAPDADAPPPVIPDAGAPDDAVDAEADASVDTGT